MSERLAKRAQTREPVGIITHADFQYAGATRLNLQDQLQPQHQHGQTLSSQRDLLRTISPYDFTLRSRFNDETASIYGWPSRGGVIILDNAQAIDFEFVRLNPIDPQPECDEDQDAEDAFCQRLLLLGAKWWDSIMRYDVVGRIKAGIPINDNRRGIGFGPHPAPSMRERRWVCVGWPSTGGLWVADFDVLLGGEVEDEDDLSPKGLGLAGVYMAGNMDERCGILQKYFKGNFYKTLEDYEGPTFLRAWEWKQTGESGRTMLTDEETFELWHKNLSAKGPEHEEF